MLTTLEQRKDTSLEKRREEEETPRGRKNMPPPPSKLGVPLPKEKRVRRSSVEKVIFLALIAVVIWRGIAVSGWMSSSTSLLSSSSNEIGSDDAKTGSGIRSGRSESRQEDDEDEDEDYGGDGNGSKKNNNNNDKIGSSSTSGRDSENARKSNNNGESSSSSKSSGGSTASRSSGSSGGGKRASGGASGRSSNSLRTQKMEDDIFETLRDDSQPLVTHKRLFIVNKPVNPDDPKDSRTKPVLQHWLESTTSDTNETLIYHFPRSLFEQLPLDEPKFEFKTCAVVGNSGVTLLKEYGEEIDNHDAVIRINMAPIRGFEKYVGKRTTFDVVNSHNVREILQGLRRWRPANEGETKLVLFETASHFARYHLCQPLLKKYGAENAILLNPLFSNRAHSLWIKLKELLEKTKNSQYNRKPMSGFFAVLYALQMCDKVDLYGFDAYTSRKKSYRYHYFDNVQGFTDVHSFDLAIEVFKFIAKKGSKGGLTINV